MTTQEALDILIFSIRDGFVQVSAFVAVTVLLFSYIEYRTGGRLVAFLENNERMQPVAGALLGLTPGCGGAIVAMPLYIRGTISFGAVVATLAATAGDSAFVILAVAPGAAVYAYGLAFAAGIAFGYAIDFWGLGLARVDAAMERLSTTMTGRGFATSNVAETAPSILEEGASKGEADSPVENRSGWSQTMSRVSHLVHLLWWIVAAGGLFAGITYLVRGAPEVSLEFGLTFFGVFTMAGIAGTALSFYLHFVGRHFISDGDAGRIRERFGSAYETFQHAAMETSMVTVWVLAGYLAYEYSMQVFALDIRALAAAAGVFAPVAGAMLGLVPGCAPQIVFAQLYALEEVIPFSALTANAISQDGDALFPLMAIDLKAAIIATIYTTVPALIVGAGVHYLWPYASFGFGVLS